MLRVCVTSGALRVDGAAKKNTLHAPESIHAARKARQRRGNPGYNEFGVWGPPLEVWTSDKGGIKRRDIDKLIK